VKANAAIGARSVFAVALLFIVFAIYGPVLRPTCGAWCYWASALQSAPLCGA
jgi:hypothetical protein